MFIMPVQSYKSEPHEACCTTASGLQVFRLDERLDRSPPPWVLIVAAIALAGMLLTFASVSTYSSA
jgi:hypothetical protein